MNTLKNWWLAIVGAVLIVLDQGFEVLNPFLVEIGIPDKWIGILKIAFGLYGAYKLKMQMPSSKFLSVEETEAIGQPFPKKK